MLVLVPVPVSVPGEARSTLADRESAAVCCVPLQRFINEIGRAHASPAWQCAFRGATHAALQCRSAAPCVLFNAVRPIVRGEQV